MVLMIPSAIILCDRHIEEGQCVEYDQPNRKYIKIFFLFSMWYGSVFNGQAF